MTLVHSSPQNDPGWYGILSMALGDPQDVCPLSSSGAVLENSPPPPPWIHHSQFRAPGFGHMQWCWISSEGPVPPTPRCVPPSPAVSCPQVCGVALVAIGIYAHLALNQAVVAGSSSAASSPVAIMVVGIIIFFVSFFGCCGAWKESYCMVTTVSGVGVGDGRGLGVLGGGSDPPPPPPFAMHSSLQFAVLLSIIFLVEIAAAIAGYVFKDKVGGSTCCVGAVPSPWLRSDPCLRCV